MKDGPGSEHEKVALRREKGALQHPKQNKKKEKEKKKKKKNNKINIITKDR